MSAINVTDMPSNWGPFIARLVADVADGNQSDLARLVGVPPQTVNRWVAGALPISSTCGPSHGSTPHSLPYLLSVAYEIPIEEVAGAIGADVLPFDQRLTRKHREHIADQYLILARLSELEPDDAGDGEPVD